MKTLHGVFIQTLLQSKIRNLHFNLLKNSLKNQAVHCYEENWEKNPQQTSYCTL